MPQSAHLELVDTESASFPQPPRAAAEDISNLSASATELARNLLWMPDRLASHPFRNRCRALCRALKPLLTALESPAPRVVSDDFRWLHDNIFMLEAELEGIREAFKPVHKVPQARESKGNVAPRIASVAENFLAVVAYEFAEADFVRYIEAFEKVTVLKMMELWMLAPVLKLILLEEITVRGARLLADPAGSYGVHALVRSLRDVGQTSWQEVVEPLVLFDRVLRKDPAGAYAHMDYDSRELYRMKVANHCRALWRQRNGGRYRSTQLGASSPGPATRRPAHGSARIACRLVFGG